MLTYVLAAALVAVTSLYVRERWRAWRTKRESDKSMGQSSKQLDSLKNRLSNYTKDPVTGLLGWQLFVDRVNQGIKECARHKFIMGIVYVDIDNFKLINDALGFESANSLLKQYAARLDKCIRQVDTVTRQGKDTFVIQLSQLSKQETAVIIVQRIFQEMAEPFYINGEELRVSVGVGLSFYPGDGVTPGELMQHAEYAMLMAKAKGKNKYQFYQERLQEDSQRELALYNSLTSGMYLEELSLTYQAIQDMANQQVLCVDTLLNWQHSGFGDITVQELFMYADRQNKLNEMTISILEKACKQYNKWREMGFKPSMLAVPLMLKQLESTQFIYKLSQVLQKSDVKPEHVMLELRNCNDDVSLDVLEKSFNMLSYLGVKVAVVSFGLGLFPLRYLKVFNVDYIKLGKGVTDDVVENKQTRQLVKGILKFADILTIHVIVSDVIDEQQANILKELGVTFMQGQLVSQPLSEQEMLDKLTNV